MPPIEVHFKNSKQRTGREYEELHHWMDDDKLRALQVHDISKIHENIRYVREKWGEEAVEEFIFHIKEDMEHRVRENLQYFGLFK